MIKHVFNNGWGEGWGWKKLEMQVVNDMCREFVTDQSQTVIINSVWYTDVYHEQVMSWLRNNTWDRIVLVAMLDAAIPQPSWYEEFDRPVLTLGYYAGVNELDLCAVFLHQHLITDAYELQNPDTIDTAYMCLNRKPHWHRKRFFRQLQSFELLDHGLVSMGSEDGKALRSLPEDCEADIMAPNSETMHYGIPNNVCNLGHAKNWNRHFVNIVTETMWDINKCHFVSEKIYKPIMGCRPFLVFDTDGAVTWLTNRGFDPYVNDFRDICDLDLSIGDNIAPFLQTLIHQGPRYWRSKFLDLQPKIQYNKARMDAYVNEQHQLIERGIICPI